MTLANHRYERIAGEIRDEVSLLLAGELKDPRLANSVNITEVRVSPGLRNVHIFFKVEGSETDRAATLHGLTAAAGFIRHELVERLQLRRAPEILFIPDRSEEYGQRIDELLRKTRTKE